MRRTMPDKKSSLSLSRQCTLLSITRNKYYYRPELSKRDIFLMRHIDEIYTDDPTRGTRGLGRALFKRFRIKAGRGKIRRLMHLMGISAIYPKKNLSKPDKQRKIYPYLLRKVPITRVNQVWSTDITYIRLKNGFVYLTAIIDWYSRFVLVYYTGRRFLCGSPQRGLSQLWRTRGLQYRPGYSVYLR